MKRLLLCLVFCPIALAMWLRRLSERYVKYPMRVRCDGGEPWRWN